MKSSELGLEFTSSSLGWEDDSTRQSAWASTWYRSISWESFSLKGRNWLWDVHEDDSEGNSKLEHGIKNEESIFLFEMERERENEF